MSDGIVMPTRYGFKNLAGKRFGRLLVLSFAGKLKRVSSWNCKCDCGNLKAISSTHLCSGHTQSCGCLHSEVIAAISTTHNASRTSEYRIWCTMIQRCTNPNSVTYPRYGGRGVRVCERWAESFENFQSDMGKRPSTKHSIDRIDGEGHYEPGNCRWVTSKVQGRNKRNNIVLTVDGESLCVSEWSERTGIPYGTIYARVRSGWNAERAVKTPLRRAGTL